MWKTSFSEAGTDAILGSFAGEAMTGNLELVAAEAAILGLIMGVKKIKEHRTEKKQRKQDEENARNLAAQQAAEQARLEEIARQQEEARIAEEQRQAELKRQADEQAAREEQARQAEIARQEAERQRQAQIDRDRQANVNRVEQNVNQIEVQNNLERSARIQQMEREQGVNVNGYVPGFDQAMRDLDRQYGGVRYDNQQRMQRLGVGPYFVPPDNDPNGGPGGDPDNPDGYDEYLRERGDEQQRAMFDPFYDMIMQITRQIATNAFNDRQKKEDQKQEEDMPGKNGSGTWKPEYQPDSRGEQPDSSGEQQQPTDTKPQQIDYNDELHLMEYEMSGIIEGLSQQELTLEQSFVELEKIEQTVKQKIPQQVRVNPTQIYSSTIATF